MSKVTIAQLRSRAQEIENELNKDCFKVKVTPYFAYGAYAYYFDFENKKQVYTGLGTKKECYAALNRCFYDIENNATYYKV